jgi:hypothetical protein
MAYSKRDWEKLVREIAKDATKVSFADHVLVRMRSRNITHAMVFDVLRKGVIQIEPEIDIKHGDIHCRMQRFTAGKPVGVVVACEDENAVECLVVTAFIIGD